MPGPQDYHCTHAEGANLLVCALKPHGGIVMWRTFVYNPEIDKDRIKRSYKEFLPLDGKFDDNVILQTKNGALRHKIDSRRFAEVMESLLKERRDAETYNNVAIHFFDLYK